MPYSFDPGASYVIAGGLGGLGRCTSRWMAEHGARNLILLSRSGPRAQEAIDLIAELRSLGVRVYVPPCDVASVSALSAALSSSMPPIKGCIQATMVLRDSIFENMTFEDWQETVKSKVDSSWNLATLLPADMSFFILLSSVAGVVGSPGQANYAAGNTYQAALAQHLRKKGRNATSIYLGWMGEVGVVAENMKYTRGMEATADLAAITTKEYLSLLETYCNPDKTALELLANQEPIIGLVTPEQLRSRGIEPPSWMDRPLFASLAQMGHDSSASIMPQGLQGEANYAVMLQEAKSDGDAVKVVLSGLLQRLSRAVSMAVGDIEAKRPMHVYGVDSLVALELRNWFAKVLKTDVTVFEITGQTSIVELASLACNKSELRPQTMR